MQTRFRLRENDERKKENDRFVKVSPTVSPFYYVLTVYSIYHRDRPLFFQYKAANIKGIGASLKSLASRGFFLFFFFSLSFCFFLSFLCVFPSQSRSFISFFGTMCVLVYAIESLTFFMKGMRES